MPKFSVYYSIVDDESAECGDVVERGIVEEGVNLRDAIKAVFQTRTNEVDGCSVDASSGRWITVNNGMEFRTGEYESRSLHPVGKITPSSFGRVCRIVGCTP